MRLRCGMYSVGVLAGAMTIAVMAAAGLGQVQVQQNNPLDANPQVGSGGSNDPVAGYVPVNGNDIVTGNVSGLKYFHGPTAAVVTGANGVPFAIQPPSVGTFSPYSFQGQQGTSSFNSFARQSAGGAQANIGATRTFYLPSSTVSTGGGSLYSSPYGSGFESSRIPRYSASPTSATGDTSQGSGPLSAGIQIRQFSATPANPGSPRDNTGPLSSPLFGLRPNSLSPDLNGGQTGTTPDAQHNGKKTTSPTDTVNPNDTGTDSSTKADARTPGGPLNNSADATNNGGVQGQAGDGKNNGSSFENSRDINQMRVSETYRGLLRRLQTEESKADAAGQAKIAADAKKTQNVQPTTPGQPERPGENATPGDVRSARNTMTPGNRTVQPLDPLTGRPRKTTPGGVTGTNSLGGDTQGTGTGGTDSTYRPRANVMSRSRLENLPDSELQAGKQVAPLKTLAETPQGAKPTAFDALMKDAEAMLKSGKYMEAADAYQTAMTTEPDNALAVIGRAQAELGGGMYESAANDLRFVFTKKPALTSVHYPIGDFIPAERQNYLIKDLQSLSTNPGPGNTASFLLCYIYYNTGRAEDVSGELSRWSNRPWKDSWENVLERAWR